MVVVKILCYDVKTILLRFDLAFRLLIVQFYVNGHELFAKLHLFMA